MWNFTQFVALCVIPVSVATAEETTLATPPGFEDVDGDSVFNPRLPYPENEGPPLPNGFRVQELRLASEFASLRPGPLAITQMAFRSDLSVDHSRSVEWDVTALNLSTTTAEPSSLSAVFDNNYGIDGFITVLSDIVQLKTDGAARPGGLPHDFDYVFDFQSPYVYDPEDGNLLVEFISTTDLAEARTWQDATAPSPVGNRFLINLAADAKIAAVLLDDVTITEFAIAFLDSPTLAGDFDRGGELNAADLDLLSEQVKAGNHLFVYDLNDDALVDNEDRQFWVEELANTFFGDTNLDQTVDFSDFLKLSSGFGEAGGWAEGDFDGSGEVQFPDFLLLSSNFGKTPEVAAVPEPGGTRLFQIGLFGTLERLLASERRGYQRCHGASPPPTLCQQA